MENPVKRLPKSLQRSYAVLKARAAAAVAPQAEKTEKVAQRPLLVPLHHKQSEPLTTKQLGDRAELASRMITLNPKGFRQHGKNDPSMSFMEQRFFAARVITLPQQRRSKRSLKKALAAKVFLEKFAANEKQNWSNWQRNHGGALRAAA